MLAELLGIEPGPFTTFLFLWVGAMALYLTLGGLSYYVYFVRFRARFNPRDPNRHPVTRSSLGHAAPAPPPAPTPS